ncbi:MAG: carboxypeptidase regulatory-like domain-containing protein [Pseudomonadota bacterium]
MKKFIHALCMLIVGSLVFAPGAMAHKVNLFAYAEAGKVYTESYFPDGKAVEGGKVLVYDHGDKLLLEGLTDTQGMFNFPIPAVDDLTIVIEATMGHKNSFKLKKADVEAGQ